MHTFRINAIYPQTTPHKKMMLLANFLVAAFIVVFSQLTDVLAFVPATLPVCHRPPLTHPRLSSTHNIIHKK